MLNALTHLAKEVKIPTETLKKFIQDFDINIDEVLSDDDKITSEFSKFTKDQKKFLAKYNNDLNKEKSPEYISKLINKPLEEVEKITEAKKENIFDNGFYKTSISSYGIDKLLGGDYQFVYDYFGKKSHLTQRDFIGYSDLYFYIIDMLEPFTDDHQLNNWGIHRAAGIILYGPPGSGKIFWAKKIANLVDYKFEEIKQSYLKTTYFNQKKSDFKDFLISVMKQKKILLFLDDFEIIMDDEAGKDASDCEFRGSKNIILHSIDKFEQEQIVMIGSAKNISNIDPEITAPGRFDMMIPIFPPNVKERQEMILYYMMQNLSDDATLLDILKFNKANLLPFWSDIAEKMKAFSNTMVIDFTQSLKKRIRNLYLKKESAALTIDRNLLEASYKEAAGKLTGDYLNSVSLFLQEASINSHEEFSSRILQLQQELQYYTKKEIPIRSIGFNQDDEVEN